MSKGVALEIVGLQKSYPDALALSNVSLQIENGQAVGIIGPNGAGKTTLIEIIMGLTKPDLGSVSINGQDIRDDANLTATLGVQLQEANLFPRVTVGKYIDLFGKLYDTQANRDKILADLDLLSHVDKKFGDLSGGLKQRVLLALSLINNPDILLLDEPTTGLDPVAREDLWSFIKEWHVGSRTLLLTSHFMDEVERLCDRVVVLNRGRVVADDTVPNLLSHAPAGKDTLQSAYSFLLEGVGHE
ncbi:ABC transporter ATP-binding protein [Erythrobacter crassostreae]|uniref:ABC transporter ATP-binding protein n=1 Tax=Erythrobacter crassostreae TaxID=2828328 RepID=A0A9X1F6S0_9SPHN|nr:ABC transporter ATP-binding protein [Erythrobacter crassostrea]MBV7260298.1 ABC transporter ATP-binding protein [Erythrobacter crassostrea]